MCRFRQRRAFTAIELLVLSAIVLVLLAIFIPYLLRTREIDHRTHCADNLRALGIALNTYAGAFQGRYPSVVYDRQLRPREYVAFTGPDSPDPFERGSAVQTNDVTACLWLLVRGGYVTDLSLFVCPSTDEYADALVDAAGRPVDARQRSNFRSGRNLSYSYCSPFTDAPGFHLDDLQASPFAVMADRNPGIVPGESDVTAVPLHGTAFEWSRGNSFNHGRAGQNVLYRNGEVRFQWTPYCGYGQDNIYTALAATPLPAGSNPPLDVNGVVGRQYGPAWMTDSYLVPTAQENAATDFPRPLVSAATTTTAPVTTTQTVTTTRATEPVEPPSATTQTTQPATTRSTDQP